MNANDRSRILAALRADAAHRGGNGSALPGMTIGAVLQSRSSRITMPQTLRLSAPMIAQFVREDHHLIATRFSATGQLCLSTTNGTRLTVAVPGVDLDREQALVKDYVGHNGVLAALTKAGVVTRMYHPRTKHPRSIRCGFVELPLVEVIHPDFDAAEL